MFEGRFYDTYYFADVIRNVLHDQFAYLRHLEEFYDDNRHLTFVFPFPKYSAFHCFIEFIIDAIIDDEVNNVQLDIRQDQFSNYENIPAALADIQPASLPINEALNYYKIEHISFEDWLKERDKTFLEARDDDVSAYYLDLQQEGPYDELLYKAVQEVFFVLFQNRRLLLLYNNIMATKISDTDTAGLPDEYIDFFSSPGRLKRFTIPKWVKRAVYYRDRGMCAICHDVSNIQLLCQDCNLKKRHLTPITSDYYEAWYSVSDES